MIQEDLSMRLPGTDHSIGRRSFVKSVMAGLALTAAGSAGLTACSPESSTTKKSSSGEISTAGYQYEAELSEGEWFHSMCTRNCYDSCLIKSKVVDGQLVQVRGDNDNPYTKGGLCVKTQNYVDYVYREDRLLYPMRRTGAKGPGCTFERISWDDAIEEITEKWKEIIEENGPEAITYWRYQGTNGASNVQGEEGLFYKMGCTNYTPAMCVNGYYGAIGNVTGGYACMDTEDIADKDLYVSWGHNESAVSLHKLKYIVEMKKKGGKIAVINPLTVPLCQWADMHIKLLPGTDVAFTLGVANHLIENNMYDPDYIAEYSIGFDEYQKSASEWTLEKTAETCGITQDEIVEFADLIWATRENSCICFGMQMGRRLNGGWCSMSAALLSSVIGHPESHFFLTGSSNGFSWDATSGAELASNLTGREYSSPSIGKVLTGVNMGEGHDFSVNPIRSLYVFNGNMMVSCPNQNLIKEGLSREDLFTIVHDIFITPTAEYADILLPAPTFFEYEEYAGAYGHSYDGINQKVIEPLGECKRNWEVCNLLGQAMGYTEDQFKRTEESVRDLMMEGKEHTYDEYIEKGWFRGSVPTREDLLEQGFFTTSGKVQFASDDLEEASGQRTIVYIPDPESVDGAPDLAAKYPLTLLTPAAKEFLNGVFGNMADNNILFDKNYIILSPEDANERGIADGDEVHVFNDRGDVNRVAKVVDGAVRKGIAISYKSTWQSETGESGSNCLTTDELEPFGRGTGFMSCLAEVAKA